MAFLIDSQDGALETGCKSFALYIPGVHSHCLSERLLVHGHLDGNVRKVCINCLVRLGLDR